MKKIIFLLMTLSVLMFAGCGEDGTDGIDGANGSDANVTFTSDINNTVEVSVTLDEILDKNSSNDEFDLNSSLVIIPTAIIPYTGGEFNIELIQQKDSTLSLTDKSILITKTVNGQVIDSEWADIGYDVIHEIYTVYGTLNYDYNPLDENITSLVQVVYFTDGETKYLQNIEVTQLAYETTDINITHSLVVDVTDGNYTVTQDENGTINITQD